MDKETADLIADAGLAGDTVELPPRAWTHRKYIFVPGRIIEDGNAEFRAIAADFDTAELIVRAVNFTFVR